MAIKAYSYAKDGSKALSKNFHVREFKCKDGSDPIFIDDELVTLLQKIRDKGVQEVFVTLHVGLGTFRPVEEENIEDHEMHSEFYSITPEAAATINQAKAEGRRIIAVGTTSIRTLESAGTTGTLQAGSGWTNIFIYPGFTFHIVDALVTNFHLPESTLLMLISAMSTREKILKAYETAVKEKYRFFSFGDAMFIR